MENPTLRPWLDHGFSAMSKLHEILVCRLRNGSFNFRPLTKTYSPWIIRNESGLRLAVFVSSLWFAASCQRVCHLARRVFLNLATVSVRLQGEALHFILLFYIGSSLLSHAAGSDSSPRSWRYQALALGATTEPIAQRSDRTHTGTAFLKLLCC